MVCSLLLPPAFFIERLRPMLLPWILAGLIISAFLLPTVISVIVAPAFFLGYLLPLTFGWWHKMGANWLLNAVILLFGMTIFLAPRSYHWPLPITTLLEAIGAFLIIGTIVYGAHLSIFKVLDHHYIKAAGRISYSYYVYHPICLFIVAHFMLPVLPESFLYNYPLPAALLFWFVSSAFAFPIAGVSYATIEKPFITYAKTLYRPREAIRT
jgi:peptidoglycan/LPS O-acetylase OafA/YrhL